jgi:hypothetical protein
MVLASPAVMACTTSSREASSHSQIVSIGFFNFSQGRTVK